MADSSQGSQAKACFDLDSIDTNSIPMDIVSSSMSGEQSLAISEGIRGTRSRTKERTRLGLNPVGGNVALQPSPTELNHLLYPILGTAESTDVFALGETLPAFNWMEDKIAKVYTYAGCKVNQATFSGSPGQLMNLSLDIVGKTETEGNAGTFPAITFDTDTAYAWSDAVLTIGGNAYSVMDWSVTINNFVVPRFTNSITATDIAPTDREVMMSITTPFTSDETALKALTLAGAAATLVLTNGGQSLSFAFANIKHNPNRTPTINGRGEIVYPQSFKSFMSSTTRELIVTHDSTA